MNKQETLVILRILRSVWVNTEINPDTVTAYQWALEDLTYADGERAAKTWMRTGKFFPKPSELREIIGNDAVGADDLAETAWIEVMAQVRRCGVRRTQTFTNGKFYESPAPEFSSELTRKTVESLGWETVCLGKQVEARKDFIFAYRAIRERNVSQIQRGTIATGDALPANVSALKELAS